MTVTRSLREDGIVVLTLDLPGKSANILNQQVFDDLDQHFDEIAAESGQEYRGLILCSAKPKFFVAGADLVGISQSLDWPAERIRKFCLDGQQTMARLASFPFPSIAAINGICVGGGLELALSCDFRICSNARNTLLGLPETNLGLVPGWRGTARTPRLIGLSEGLDLVTTGRLVNSDEADALLLIDDVVEFDELIEACAQFVLECDQAALAQRRNLMDSPIIDGQIKANSFEEWQSKIQSNSAVHFFAAETVAEHMIRSASMNLTDAGVSEAEAMVQVWGCESNRGLLHKFFVDERIKKVPSDLPRDAATSETNCIGILGSGQMGSQIARLLTRLGSQIVVYDADHQSAEALANELQESKAHAWAVQELSGLKKCDFVIESIVENVGIKRDVLGRLESEVEDSTVIASNTSAIPLGDIAAGLKHPQRLVGFHFCHPVKQRLICEVIGSDSTSEMALATAIGLARKIKKMPLVVGDSPGFIVNRLLAPYLDQAMELVRLGVPVARVDQAMLDFGFGIGPLRFIDSIGVETIFHAGIIFAERIPDLVGRNRILTGLIKAKRTGEAAGQGFYNYTEGKPSNAPQLQAIIEHARDDDPQIEIADEEIVNSLLVPMIVEGSQLLENKVVRDARDIDFATVHGCSFPAFRGGLMYWADLIGAEEIVARSKAVQNLRPIMKISNLMQQMVTEGRKYHE